MKKAVITGATGAIGRALVGLLASSFEEVLVLARPGSARNAHLPQTARVRVLEVDLSAYPALFSDAALHYDVFFHLAWGGTHGAAREDTALQSQNVCGAREAARLAVRLGCHTFVGVGSQAEYGPVPPGTSLHEGLPCRPQSAYGCAKLEAAAQTREICQKNGLCHVWARCFSVYGVGDRPTTLIMQLLAAFSKGESIPLTAGDQIWDYLHAEDAARALLLLAEKGQDGACYNLASGEARPLRAYVEQVRDVLAPTLALRFGTLPYYGGQAMNLAADVSRLKLDTGFRPQIAFADGIAALARQTEEL